jgi:hypothetical protein
VRVIWAGSGLDLIESVESAEDIVRAIALGMAPAVVRV